MHTTEKQVLLARSPQRGPRPACPISGLGAVIELVTRTFRLAGALAWAWLAIVAAWGGSLVQIHTPVGSLVLELYDQDKPVTVANFLKYVDTGAYRDAFSHRLVPGFIVQGGGFMVTNRSTAPLVATCPNYGTITNEFNVGARLTNEFATVAMAKVGGDPNSASSQWFINLANNAAHLDNQNGGFTVFGRVVAGTNVLEIFNRFTRDGSTNVVVNLGGVLSELPVLTTNVTFGDLIYTDVSRASPPTVDISRTSAGETIVSWTSVSNLVHRLEAAPQWPAVWQSVAERLGTGGRQSFILPQPLESARFFRVVLPR